MKIPHWWQGASSTALLLTPLSLLYQCAARLHRAFTPAARAGAPVISVGNIVAGGAGKTPTVMALTELVKAMGYQPHILSRGYGATLAAPMKVNPKLHSARDVGDEALLLARAAPTWVFPKRSRSAQHAITAGADLLLCDDALQHHRLRKDINLLVIDGAYGTGNGKLLPAGPLRESLRSALKRVDGIVFIGEDQHLMKARIPPAMPVLYGDIVPVGDVGFLYEKPLIAFAGIARPEKFFASLTQLGATMLSQHAFADHHPYSDAELQMLRDEAHRNNARLVTTEKDWVRLPTEMRKHCHSLPVALRFRQPETVLQFLLERLPHAAH